MGNPPADKYQSAGYDISAYDSTQDACKEGAQEGILKNVYCRMFISYKIFFFNPRLKTDDFIFQLVWQVDASEDEASVPACHFLRLHCI